jgi:hypothetical protein
MLHERLLRHSILSIVYVPYATQDWMPTGHSIRLKEGIFAYGSIIVKPEKPGLGRTQVAHYQTYYIEQPESLIRTISGGRTLRMLGPLAASAGWIGDEAARQRFAVTARQTARGGLDKLGMTTLRTSNESAA